MKKKVVSLLAAMALAVTALAGCGSNDAATTGTDAATVAATTEAAGTTEAATDSEAVTGVKAGFIFLHDENSMHDPVAIPKVEVKTKQVDTVDL